MRQCKDQRADCHQHDSAANPTGLGGGRPSPKVGERDEDAEGGKVVGTGHGRELGGPKVIAPLDGRDADVN